MGYNDSASVVWYFRRRAAGRQLCEGNPSIHAYNPTTGAFLGTIQNENGDGIAIDELWLSVLETAGPAAM